MLTKLIKEIRDIKMDGVKYFNNIAEIASRLHLIDDNTLKVQIIELLGILEQKNQQAMKNRQEDDE